MGTSVGLYRALIDMDPPGSNHYRRAYSALLELLVFAPGSPGERAQMELRNSSELRYGAFGFPNAAQIQSLRAELIADLGPGARAELPFYRALLHLIQFNEAHGVQLIVEELGADRVFSVLMSDVYGIDPGTLEWNVFSHLMQVRNCPALIREAIIVLDALSSRKWNMSPAVADFLKRAPDPKYTRNRVSGAVISALDQNLTPAQEEVLYCLVVDGTENKVAVELAVALDR